jgi:hypothetical protein
LSGEYAAPSGGSEASSAEEPGLIRAGFV